MDEYLYDVMNILNKDGRYNQDEINDMMDELVNDGWQLMGQPRCDTENGCLHFFFRKPLKDKEETSNSEPQSESSNAGENTTPPPSHINTYPTDQEIQAGAIPQVGPIPSFGESF